MAANAHSIPFQIIPPCPIMSTLISVPAGRCVRRSPDTKWIDPQAEKGLVEMRFEDDLMHLCELGGIILPAQGTAIADVSPG